MSPFDDINKLHDNKAKLSQFNANGVFLVAGDSRHINMEMSPHQWDHVISEGNL